MGERTRIEWTDATWNPTTGCTKVSSGCDHCYAAVLAHGRLSDIYLGRAPAEDNAPNRRDPFAVRLWPERLVYPLRWKDPRRIFVNSMSDLFHADIPEEFQRRVFEVMLEADRHIYQVLTKRPSRAERFVRRNADLFFGGVVPEHIWIGTSVESRGVLFRVDQLREVAAAVRFLSCEPLLGPLELDLDHIDWVIVGGESGIGYRPLDLHWARSIRDQCLDAEVAFFFKQVGGRTPKAGGRLLDGTTWDEMPRGRRHRLLGGSVFSPEPLRDLPDDGLYLPSIKPHSLEKFRAHNHNVQIFSTAMNAQWPQRAYIGLYSGAGRARLQGTGEIVETTAMSVFRLPDPFTHYIFVDNDARCTEALRARIRSLPGERNAKVFTGDVNSLVADVRAALPPFSSHKGLLSYCFVDPFAADLKFETIKLLGQLRMDFLILLMLGLDARVNFKKYLDDEDDTRIAELVDCPNWREEWRRESTMRRPNVIRYLMKKFDEAMTRIGYQSAPSHHALSVKVHNKGVLVYQLVFYSKKELGQKFWKATRTMITPQQDFFAGTS